MATVIYLSRAGENLENGAIVDRPLGHTAVLAKEIARQLGTTPVPLHTKERYPINYEKAVEVIAQQQDNHVLPALDPLPVDLEKEQDIYLGFPIWLEAIPQPIVSFVKEYSLNGKNLYPFSTREHTIWGDAFDVIKKECPDVKIFPGLSLRGTSVYKPDISKRVAHWLNDQVEVCDD